VPTFLTETDLSESLRVAPQDIRTLVDQGELPRPLCFGSRLRWDRDDVYAALYRKYEAAYGA
jgi:hypothetical protein